MSLKKTRKGFLDAIKGEIKLLAIPPVSFKYLESLAMLTHQSLHNPQQAHVLSITSKPKHCVIRLIFPSARPFC